MLGRWRRPETEIRVMQLEFARENPIIQSVISAPNKRPTLEVGSLDYVMFANTFDTFIGTAPHWQLKEISKKLTAVQKARFVSGRAKRCELVEKGFTDETFSKFMSVVKDQNDRAFFILMATLGLRADEAVMLRGRDLQGDQLRIRSSKGGFSARLRLPSPLLKVIPATEPEDKIFPFDTQTYRRRFREYREKAGLEEVYMETEPCGRARKAQRRYTVSLHSFRHYAIQKFYERCKDPNLTRAFARHRHLSTTEIYLKGPQIREVESVLEATLNGKNKAKELRG